MGTLDVLSITSRDGPVYLIDVKALGKRAFEGALRELLESKSITKLVFDSRNDADALWHIYGVKLQGVVDVQLLHTLHTADANAPSRASFNDKFKYNASTVRHLTGLKSCIDLYLGKSHQELTKIKESVGKEMTRDKDVWGERPLRTDLQKYCAIDTTLLFPLYDILKEGKDMGSLREASERYADCFRTYSSLPALEYYQNR